MGKKIANATWVQLMTSLEDSMEQGEWVAPPDASWLFTRPCYAEPKFHEGNCALSNLASRHVLRWLPTDNSTTMREFSASRLCSIMQGRDILIVGDSLSYELYVTLVSAMLANDTSTEKTAECSIFKTGEMLSELMPCSSAWPSFNVSYVPSAHLLLEEVADDSKAQRVALWLKTIARLNSSLLILNTGMHFHPTMPHNVMAAVSNVSAAHPDVSIMYRYSPPGHVGCESEYFSAPLSTAQNESVYHQNHTKFGPRHYTRAYRWFDVVEQNYELQRLLHDNFPQVVHINVVNSTALRVDQHLIKSCRFCPPDCLHYCLPGPIDQWVIFIYNALVRIQEVVG